MTENLPWGDRPYRGDKGWQLVERYRMASDDIDVVKAVAYELQFRHTVSVEIKAEVLDKLIFLYDIETLKKLGELLTKVIDMKNSIPEKLDINFDTKIKLTRKEKIAQVRLKGRGWRDIGLLKASGYSVGVTEGVAEGKRHAILNHLFLKDDLSDIDDCQYAAEWGQPKTGMRLKKIVDSIVAFTKNQKRKTNPSYVAIEEWESDLDHLKATFYERWGDFPWPDVEL